MKLIVVGLGKMGMQIVKRAVNAGFEVLVLDPDTEAVARAEGLGAQAAADRQNAVMNFYGKQVIVWLMIPANIVNSEIDAWADVLPEHSLLIDGGNSNYRRTQEHAKRLDAKNIRMMDIGVSGGILGEKNGFSMMAAGDGEGYQAITPLLDVLAKPRGGHRYFGAHGAGHYVKMVHNAVEYGMMQSLAEGYDMLKQGPYESLDLAAAGDVWQESSVIASNLNGLAAEVMRENPKLDGISGYVAESGEARWTLEAAKERGIELPATQAAFDVRVASAQGKISYATKMLAALRHKFGGHKANK